MPEAPTDEFAPPRPDTLQTSASASASDDHPYVRLRGLTRRFHGRTAVHPLNLEIRRGEVIGFLGPNGAGKSTTMRMITGYLPPTAGTAEVAGFDVTTDPVGARRHIGYMPENVPLYTDMRVKDYLRFRGRLKGLGPAEMRARVEEVMRVCGLTDVRRRLIGNLSKGYRQRIGLADAMVHQPGLLILDEPTNGLDPNQIRQARDLIRSLAGRHTILLSTHILGEVEQICDRVIIIDEGRVKAIDTPDALVGDLRAVGLVRVETACPDPGLALAAFHKVPGVRLAEHEGECEPGWHSFLLRAESGHDVRQNVSTLAAENGWPLRELHRLPARLEDVFVEMTQRPNR